MSSEGGLARFWDIFGPREPIGKEESQIHNSNSYYKYFLITGVFPLTEFEGEIVLSLRVDPQDHCLLAGDTSGVISIFDISQYATSPTQGQVMNTDPILPLVTPLPPHLHTLHTLSGWCDSGSHGEMEGPYWGDLEYRTCAS